MSSSSNKRGSGWIIKIIIISFLLTLVISYASAAITGSAGVLTALLVLLLLLAFSLVTDLIGIAVISADERPVISMAAKRIPGAKQALWLIRHAPRVSNILSDVVGDICGIVSGAACVALALRLMPIFPFTAESVLNMLVSASIAALTIGGKSTCKIMGMQYAREVVLATGRVLSIFMRGR